MPDDDLLYELRKHPRPEFVEQLWKQLPKSVYEDQYSTNGIPIHSKEETNMSLATQSNFSDILSKKRTPRRSLHKTGRRMQNAFQAALVFLLVGLSFIFYQQNNKPNSSIVSVYLTPTLIPVVSCVNYPQYCVPLAGGGSGELAAFEAVDVRSLDTASTGSLGVIRGVNADEAPIIGNPLAPLRVAIFLDFTTWYSTTYYLYELRPFIQDYILTGQASLEIYFITPEELVEWRAVTVFAAGEQGAFWETMEAIYDLHLGDGPQSEFSPSLVQNIGERVGLDTNPIIISINSNRFSEVLRHHRIFAQELNIDSLPTVATRTDNEQWIVQRDSSYEALALLVARASGTIPSDMDAIFLRGEQYEIDLVHPNSGDIVRISVSVTREIVSENEGTPAVTNDFYISNFEAIVVTIDAENGNMILALSEDNRNMLLEALSSGFPINIE